TTRVLLLERLAGANITTLLSTKVEEIREGRVRARNQDKELWMEGETIVLALGSRANQEVLKNLQRKVPQLLPVGDCLQPRRAKEAIHEGFLAALRI
ncbi:MAG: NADH:flavin oxidoreductase, partial [Deltaproteobacteria bacterium]|nr:NADH:flavin oxidoreductase [Deltaproteobacteria bacterium]